MTLPPGVTGRRLAGVMAGSFALALAVRLVYLVALSDSVYFDHLLVDADWHDAWARGEWTDPGRAHFRAPLYPWFLRAVYAVWGADPAAARVVQAVLGASGAAALAGTAARWAGLRAGGAAGVLASLYGTWVFFDGELLIPALLVPLLCWSVFTLAVAPTRGGWALSALLLGLAAIARPNALVLVAPFAVAAAAMAARTGPAGEPAHTAGAAAGRGRPARAALYGVLALVPALLVTADNLRREGEWVFVASQGGVNLAAGNHEFATGRSAEHPLVGSLLSWDEFVARSRSVPADELGRAVGSAEASAWWVGLARDWVRRHPAEALALTGRKAWYLVQSHEIASNRDPYFRPAGVLRALLWSTPWLSVPWGLVLPLALAGLVLSRGAPRLRGPAAFLAAWLVLYGLSLVPFFVTGRFRMALVPALVLLAAAPFAGGWSRRRIPAVAVGLLALVAVNLPLLRAKERNVVQQQVNHAALLLEAGRMEEGTAELEKAVAADPDRPEALFLLADARYEAGDAAGAAELFERVVGFRPANHRARFTLGTCYLQLERYDAAASALEAARQLEPHDIATLVNLGVAYEAQGRDAEAMELYREAVERQPHAVLAHIRWGELLLRRGQADDAVAVLDEAVRLNQGSFDLRLHLATALNEAGQPELALEEVDSALHMRHEDPLALRMQRMLLARIDSLRSR